MSFVLKQFAKNHWFEILILFSILFYDLLTLIRFFTERRVDLGFFMVANIIFIILGSYILIRLKGVYNETEAIQEIRF